MESSRPGRVYEKPGTVKMGARSTGWRFVGDPGYHHVVVVKRMRTKANPKDLERLREVAAVYQDALAHDRPVGPALAAAFPGYHAQTLSRLVWRARNEAGLLPPTTRGRPRI